MSFILFTYFHFASLVAMYLVLAALSWVSTDNMQACLMSCVWNYLPKEAVQILSPEVFKTRLVTP